MSLHRLRMPGVVACWVSLVACAERPKDASFRVAPCELKMANVAEKTRCAFVTGSFFQGPHHQPLIGRIFQSDEYQAGASSPVLLSYSIWQRRFGGDPSIIGRALQLDGRNRIVLGIMPKSFDNPPSVDAWIPQPDVPK